MRNVLIISIMGVGGGFIKNILLARELTKEDIGLFFLLMTVAGFLSPITLVGQHNAFVRFISDKTYSEYNWKSWYLQKSLISFLITIILVIIATPIYRFNLLSVLFLLTATYSCAVTDLYASIYRAQGRYEISMFIFQFLSLILPIAAFLLLIVNIFNFENVLIAFLLLYLLNPFFLIGLTKRHLIAGKKKFPSFMFQDGLFLWGMDISVLIVISIDKLLLPKLISYEAMGEYFAIYSLTRGFELIFRAVEFVLFPQIKRSRKTNLGYYTLSVFCIGFFISVVYILGGEFLLNLLFKGNYTNTSYLIPYFCILGTIRLIHTVPYSIIGGYLRQERLKQLFHINVISVFIAISLSAILIILDGLRGAIVSTIIVWFFKTVAGYGIIWRENTYKSPI